MPLRQWFLRSLVLLPAMLPLALAGKAAAGPPEGPATLLVFAGAGLKGPLEEIARVFEGRRGGVRVVFNFAGSHHLAAQIERGAPADVFVSGDAHWMAFLEGRGLVTGPETFASNTLAVVTAAGGARPVRTLLDLARPGVKVVLGADATPVGRHSRLALARFSEAPGFPRDFARRVLANVVSEEENDKLVLARVSLGEADAGIVHRSDTLGPGAPRVGVLEEPVAN